MKNKTYHGKSNTRLYHIYASMIQRCYNTNCNSYKNYGERGITICQEWLDDFMNFYNWSMDNGYDELAGFGKCTIDRIDVNGSYEPNNCRWVDSKTQCRNKRDNVYYFVNGKKYTLAELSEMSGIPLSALNSRIYELGWSVERAIKEKVCYVRYNGEKYTYDGITLSLTDWSKRLGVPRTTLEYRLKSGRPFELVFTNKKDIHVLKNNYKAVV